MVVGINGRSTSSMIVGFRSNEIPPDVPWGAVSAGHTKAFRATVRNDVGVGFADALRSSLIVNDMR